MVVLRKCFPKEQWARWALQSQGTKKKRSNSSENQDQENVGLNESDQFTALKLCVEPENSKPSNEDRLSCGTLVPANRCKQRGDERSRTDGGTEAQNIKSASEG
jgi:hypothetical protein